MFIIFGTTGMKTRVSDEAPMINSCPNCSKDLVLKKYKRWFTLFFLPIFPIETIDTFYECSSCKSAYGQHIKAALTQGQAERENAINEAKKIYAKTLIATMTHMAMIDGDFAKVEEEYIEEVKQQFSDYSSDVNEAYDFVKNKGNDENYVFNLLNAVRDMLSTEGLLTVLAQSAKVLLADGRIDKEEEVLMKEYLVACGLPKDMYKTLLDKIKEPEAVS